MFLAPSPRHRHVARAAGTLPGPTLTACSALGAATVAASRNALTPGTGRRLLYLANPREAAGDHRRLTQRCLAERIAAISGMEFVDRPMARNGWTGPLPYLVPYETLDHAAAARWKLRKVEQFFGGVVPHPFVATKAVVHGRATPDAPVPEGWSDRFAAAVGDLVLPGYSAFDRASLVTAVHRLLKAGPVRLKAAAGSGGRGQRMLRSIDDLASCEDLLEEAAMRQHGVVVEPDLHDARTISIGQAHLGGIRVSYCGVQHSIALPSGEQAYAGSDLYCVRGGLDVLRSLRLPAQTRLALDQARHFHRAVLLHFPGTLISRANYDVIQGQDARGQLRSGVLEQSWRIGGASGAEIEAVRLLLENPQRRCVAARTVERHDGRKPPPDAWVVYRQPNAVDAPTLKYVQVVGDVPGW